MTRRFLLDLLERAGRAFVATFGASLVSLFSAGGLTTLSISSAETVLISAIGAAGASFFSVLMSVGASQVGSPGTASVLPAAADPAALTRLDPAEFVEPDDDATDADVPLRSAKYRGLLPSWPDFRDLAALDYLADTVPPKTLNLNRGLKLNILGNATWGDCFWAALAHAKQTVYNAAGKTWTPTPDLVLGWYATYTGFRYTKATDQGTEPRAGLKAAMKAGIISGFAQVPTDPASMRKAIAGYQGGVILCWGLPQDVPEDGIWKTVTGPIVDGHATQGDGYMTTYLDNDTWAEKGRVYPPFEGAYLQQAFAVTFPDGVQPAVDHAAHQADIARARVA